jgi:hypothetical protein
MSNENTQTLRRILVDLEVGGRAAFNKDERRLVLQILLDLIEKVDKLDGLVSTEDAGRARKKD